MHADIRRTFIAFRVTAGKEILDCLGRLKVLLTGARIKWVDHEKMHITLTFIGNTPANKIREVSGIMDNHVPSYPAPDLFIKGIGVFRNPDHPKVIWLGVDPMPGLNDLKDKIDRDLRHDGFNIERREFKPHLTLGRIKSLRDKSGIIEMIREYQDRPFLKGSIEELVLYESVLRPQGPEYIPLSRSKFRYAGP